MITMAREMRDHIDNFRACRKPWLLATALAGGNPGLGYTGGMLAYGNKHLAYSEWRGRSGLERLKENPHMAVFYSETDPRAGSLIYWDIELPHDGYNHGAVWESTPRARLLGAQKNRA